MKYAIIDIETTGGNPKTERITEIAVFVHDGENIVDEFVTLINPEKIIPPYITALTGISDDMVADAPKFFEIAKKLVQITNDTVFVAHNANFDYGFIKHEFKSLGFDYQRKTLDTVRLSRKILPGHGSYSLGNLCNDLNIKINGRHRAAGDALATVKLFELLLSKKEAFAELANPEQYKFLKGIDAESHRAIISNVPEATGVYYFFDTDGHLIYIGKSNNIKKRVAQHLRNTSGKKALEMRQRIAEVQFEITGSELVALLLESAEIKKHKPLYNRTQRRTGFSVGLFTFYDIHGYINFKLDKLLQKNGLPIATFLSMAEAKEFLNQQVERYLLCQKLCSLYKTEGACFHFGVAMCKGACVGKESAQIYNKRALEFMDLFRFKVADFLIIDKGNEKVLKSAVLVRNGKYQGFGFFDPELTQNTEQILDCVKSYEDNRDVQQIIKSFIRKNKFQKMIYLEA